jgi:non-specific serine/threonine protein kinase
VPPLELPPVAGALRLDNALASEAVRLFVDRARAVQNHFQLTEENAEAIVAICRRLDGLPLAIELAAARTSLLPPSALLRRLDRLLPLLTSGRRDAPDRHKTLYATIAWSYDLLSPDAQRLFARLAVFAGGFELESAETVCAADLDAIGSLADSSLIRLDGERFTMLAAIREYALDRLKEADEEAELRMQHAHYFHEMARKAEPELTGPDQATWLARLDANIDNLRAALVFYREDGRGGILLRMSAALFRFWFVRGYLREGARWLDEALGLTNTTIGVEGRDALAAAAQLAYRLGNIAEAHALNHQALLACQTAADDAGIGRTLNRMADVAEAEGDLDQAERLWRKSIAIARRASDRFGLAVATGNLGSLMLTRGEYDRAIPLVAESMEMHRQLGNVHGQAVALENLGSAASRQGRYDDAVPLLKESLQLFHVLASPVYVASVIDEIAAVLAFQGNAVTATRLLGVTDALLRETGGTLSPDALELRTRLIHVVREQLAEVEYKRAQMDGSRTRTLDEAVEYALAALA